MLKKRAVFLDRDGTIVRGVEYLRHPEELSLMSNAAEGIRLFNEEGYLAIIVTNQSGVARGYFTEERLHEIHTRLREMLLFEGARVDGIYYCPHLPEGIVEAYRVDCQCRKPRPEMLLRAAREFNIALEESIMIGDTPGDVLAGKAAGCKTALVADADFLPELISVSPDYTARDVLEAARLFLSREPRREGSFYIS